MQLTRLQQSHPLTPTHTISISLMEYQAEDTLEIDFSVDSSNFDSLITSMSPEDFYGWLSPGEQLQQTPEVKPIQMDSIDFEPLSVELPDNNWSGDIKPEPDFLPFSPSNALVTRIPVKRETKKPRKTGKTR